MKVRADHLLALLLLVVSCVNEFSWQLWPVELQGAWTYVTAAPLQWVLALLAAVAWVQSRAMVAALAAVFVQSIPTAACSAAWLWLRWSVAPGSDLCSPYLGHAALLLSASAALIVLWRWPRHG